MNTDELQEHAAPSRHLVARPKALQWFHHKTLHKASLGERQASRFELFLDLLYVALVANFAEDFAANPTGKGLVKYILIFAPAWHVWSDLREIMNSYYTDDLIQRLIILWMMALLVLYGNNATEVAVEIGAMRTTVGAYMTARATTAAVYTICSFASYQHRAQARFMVGFILLGLCLWIPLFFESVDIRVKIALAAVAIVYQEVVWIITFGPWIKKKLKLTYSTAVDIAHEIDRLAAFFIIVLGEYLYSIIVGNPTHIGLTLGFLKAVWTLIIAFCLNWLYVNGDGSIHFSHPIRRSATTSFTFFILHMPMTAALLVGGHVAAVSAGHDELNRGERWLLGGGLGIGMACLWLLAMLFKSKDRGELVLSKSVRVGVRLVVALILVLLPLTDEARMGPVRLLSTIMGLFAFVLVWETVGGLAKGARVYEKWEDRHAPRIEYPPEKFTVDG